ncbi:hypothetical protein BGZ65_012325, partial [Modicella reniformis]
MATDDPMIPTEPLVLSMELATTYGFQKVCDILLRMDANLAQLATMVPVMDRLAAMVPLMDQM